MDKEIKILVFKTNLENVEKIQAVETVLNQQPGILRWNVDHWDVDKVLRIETRESSSAHAIIEVIRRAGFDCDELPD